MIYAVSIKEINTRSPYHLWAYVEAETPKLAIEKFKNSYPNIDFNEQKCNARKSKLPDGFWNRSEHIRTDYIK